MPYRSTPQIKSGTVKCPGVTNNGRYPLTPEIPTMIEQGIDGYGLSSWTSVFVPKGPPRPVYDKLRTEVLKAISDPEYPVCGDPHPPRDHEGLWHRARVIA